MAATCTVDLCVAMPVPGQTRCAVHRDFERLQYHSTCAACGHVLRSKTWVRRTATGYVHQVCPKPKDVTQ